MQSVSSYQLDAKKLMELWHLSKVPTSGSSSRRYDRLQWTVKWYCKDNPEVPTLVVYKRLDAMTYGY